LDEISHLMNAIEPAGLGYMLLLDVFILVAALTVMNMLVGVLCEVVSAVAASEKEELSLRAVSGKVAKIFADLGHEHGSNITRLEFDSIMQNPETVLDMKELGVDVIQMVDTMDVIFTSMESEPGDDMFSQENVELPLTEFMEVVGQLRGSNTATVKDLVDMRNYLSKLFQKGEQKTQERVMNTIRASSGAFSNPTSFNPTCSNTNMAAADAQARAEEMSLAVQKLDSINSLRSKTLSIDYGDRASDGPISKSFSSYSAPHSCRSSIREQGPVLE